MSGKISRLRALLYICFMSFVLLILMKLISKEQHPSDINLAAFMLKEGLVTSSDVQSIIRQTYVEAKHHANSKQFRTKSFFVRGQDWQRLSSDRRVCLASHAPLDKLYWIVELCKAWADPVSVAVFTPDVDFHVAVVYLKYLLKCFPEVRDRVSFHVTFPAEGAEGEDGLQESEMLSDVVGGMSCEDPRKVLKLLLLVTRSGKDSSASYPENLLANVAVAGCKNDFIMLSDVDMIPMQGLDKDLHIFLASSKGCDGKCAFVVPAFEVSDQVKHLPEDKGDLAHLVQQRRARTFMQNVSSLHQKPSNLKMWLKIPARGNMGEGLRKAFKVEHYEFGYEPIYVARREDLISFDERFSGPGMSRNTQVYEMFVSGREFFVLDNAFALHRGFRSLGDLGAKPRDWKDHPKFKEFARDVAEKYGKDPYDMMSKLEGVSDKGTSKVSYWNAASDM